jgi:hypothetical protein
MSLGKIRQIIPPKFKMAMIISCQIVLDHVFELKIKKFCCYTLGQKSILDEIQ